MSFARDNSRIAATGIITVENFQAVRNLRLYSGSPPQQVFAEGHSVSGDGGAGFFTIQSTTLEKPFIDDDGITLNITASGGILAAVRNCSNVIDTAWYGPECNKVADDSEIIRKAIDALPLTGGTIILAPNIGIGSEIRILRSAVTFKQESTNVAEYIDNSATPAVLLVADIPDGYMFRVGDVDNPDAEVVMGIEFSNVVFDGQERLHEALGAIYIEEGHYSKINSCHFTQIRGSAFKLRRVIKGKFHKIDVVACGSVGNPAVWLHAIANNNGVQGSSFSGMSVEACYDDTYIKIDRHSKANKFNNITTETTHSATVPERDQIILHDDGLRNSFTNCHFTLDDVDFNLTEVIPRVWITGNDHQSVNFGLRGSGPLGHIAYIIDGLRAILTNITLENGDFNENVAEEQVIVNGENCTITNMTFDNFGGIVINGRGVIVNGANFNEPRCQYPIYLAEDSRECRVTNCLVRNPSADLMEAVFTDSGIQNVISSNTFTFDNNVTDRANAIAIYANGSYSSNYDDNTILSFSKDGIVLNDVLLVSVNDNRIIEYGVESTDAVGIRLTSTANKIHGGVISGNHVYSSNEVLDGIRIETVGGGIEGLPGYRLLSISGNTSREGINNGSWGPTSGSNNLLTGNIFADTIPTSELVSTVQTIEELREYIALGRLDNTVYVNCHTTLGDGGGGSFSVREGSVATYTDDGGVTILALGGDGSKAYVRDATNLTYAAWFGMSGGTQDDAPALQKCVAYLGGKGGQIILPQRVRLDQTVTVQTGGIIFVGSGGFGKVWSAGNEGSYVAPGNDIAGPMFEFNKTATDSNIRGCGLKGIGFNGLERAYSVHSAIYVDCDNFIVEDLSFMRLKGSAIHVQRSIKSKFSDIDILECGDIGRPAMLLTGDLDVSQHDIVQSSEFTNMTIEHNYGDQAHLHVGSTAKHNKFVNLGFEQKENALDVNTTRAFIFDEGEDSHYSVVHANQLQNATEQKIIFAGTRAKCVNLTVSGRGDAGSILLTGGNAIIDSFTLTSSAHLEGISAIEAPGNQVIITNGVIAYNGGINLGGKYSKVSSIIMYQIIGDYGVQTAEQRNVISDVIIFESTVTEGFRIGGQYSKVIDCIFAVAGDVGINIAIGPSTAAGNIITGANEEAILLEGVSSVASDNQIQTAGGVGILATGTSCDIVNNRISGTGAQGIFCNGNAPRRLLGNSVYTFNGVSNSESAIEIVSVSANVNGVVVTGNVVDDFDWEYGLKSDSNTQYVVVTGNNFRKGSGISVLGANSVIGSNV